MSTMEFVSLDVTYRCNYSCLHCFNSSGSPKSFCKEMTEEELLNVGEQLAEFEPMSFCVCGGEPLLRAETVFKLGKKVKEKATQTSVNLVTNGYLMTDEIASKLKESNFNLVQVSLDGISNDTHNWLRQNDAALDRAIQAIRILVKHGFYTGVACAPTKKNLKEIPQVIAKAYELGVKMFRIQPLMLLGRARENLKDYMLDEYEYFSLVETLDEEKHKYPEMEISWGDPIQHIADIRTKDNKVNFVSVNAFGKMVLSPYIPVDFGDLKVHSLREYVENGYLEINKSAFVKRLFQMIDDSSTLEVHEKNDRLPILGVEENIHMDIMEKSVEEYDRILLEKYFG